MEQKGATIQLSVSGPNGGTVLVIVDYDVKTISLVEISSMAPQWSGNAIRVLEVQTYSMQGG